MGENLSGREGLAGSEETEEIVRLRCQVSEAGGKIRVWIHPYYMGDDRAYVPVMERIVAKLGEGKGGPNLFFIPDGRFFEGDRRRILNLAGEGKEKCYFIRTALGNPRPVAEEGEEPEAWNRLRTLLRGVGVTDCLVGGETATGEKIVSPEVASGLGCMNEAMNQLSVAFRVERSNVASPINRAALLKRQKSKNIVQ